MSAIKCYRAAIRCVMPVLFGMISATCGAAPQMTGAPVPTHIVSDVAEVTTIPLNPGPPMEGILRQIDPHSDANNKYIKPFDIIDIPDNWTHTTESSDYYYYDTLTSPIADAWMENLVYNDGNAFDAAQSFQFALDLLNSKYSSTGREGDIRITKSSTSTDNSVSLTWQSISGEYSGISFFELYENDHKTFIMFTAWWKNSADQATLDEIDDSIFSYSNQ